jgi:hypothetical protein
LHDGAGVIKFAFLPKMIRYLPVIFIAAGFATIASIAHASMTCTRIDEFPVVSDPSIQERLEAHVKALQGIKNYQIRDIDGRFFIVLADDGYCKETPPLLSSAAGYTERCGQGRLFLPRHGQSLEVNVSVDHLAGTAAG